MDFIASDLHMWLVFAIVIGAVFTYSIETISLELSSFATVTLLLLLFYFYPLTDTKGASVLTSRDILMGFADPALITIMALLVVGQALVQTGALVGPSQALVKWGAKAPRATIFFSFLTVMALSAVLNNTPVVVMFIPILAVLAEKMGKRPGLVMMPLSFVAILGGNLTLIGSSTNLLALGSFELAGGGPVGFFDFAIPGLVLALVGFAYILFMTPRLLSDNDPQSSPQTSLNGKQFLFQLELDSDNKMVGAKAVAGLFPELKNLTVRMIQRGHKQFLPPYDGITLQEGDLLMAAATRATMTELLHKDTHMVADVEGEAHEETKQTRLIAEVVVAPASRLDGRTIAFSGFRSETGCVVIGVQRRSRMVRAALAHLRLEAGDILLVMGRRDNIMGLRGNRDVLLMESSAVDLPKQAFALRAQLIFSLVVIMAATGLLPIVMTALLGAVLMIALGCLNIRQAGRAVDRRVYAIVGAALALGTALQATGGASFVAHSLVSLLAGSPTWMILSGLFLLIAFFTNILSNNATAVLFTPIAVSLAQELHLPPLPFLVTVIFAANASFATPMSYQTNLLVMTPGEYQFRDFLRMGTPLIFLLWVAFTLFVPWYYGLVG